MVGDRRDSPNERGRTDEASSANTSRAAVWVDDATGQTGCSWVIYEFARKRQPSSSRALKFEAKHWNFICDARWNQQKAR